MKKIFTLASILLLHFSIQAQTTLPVYNAFFNQDEVIAIHISMPEDSLNLMLNDISIGSSHYFQAQFIFESDILKDTLENVGFRLRGNTSLGADKKSFKISFNEYAPGRHLLKQKKMNLNGEHNDPSLIRRKLSHDLLRALGLPSIRTSHARLYINGNYYGVYANTEEVDKEYLDNYFNDNDGNLYKCTWPADLDFINSNPEAYKFEDGGERVYDLKTNNSGDDYTNLANFISTINNTSASDMYCAVENIFNSDVYLKYLAFDVIISNWDGYYGNMNNYYLYENPSTERMEYFPFDLDNTWGINWFSFDWAERDPYNWQLSGDRPLVTALLTNPEWFEQFETYVHEISDVIKNDFDISTRIADLITLVGPYVENDPFYPLDYGFNYDDFISSASVAAGQHVEYGIESYINKRLNSITDQIGADTENFYINYTRDNYPELDSIRFRVFVDGNPDQVQINLTLNGSTAQQLILYDDGMHKDRLSGDGLYANSIDITDGSISSIEYTSSAIKNGQVKTEPCDPISLNLSLSNISLFINELMASNETVIADEAGEYDDWFEIYNNSNAGIDLSNVYASDDIDNPGKFKLPSITLGSGEFLCIWADENGSQGPIHANFKLNASGEAVFLHESSGNDFKLIDQVIFGALATDESYGREKDADPDWQVNQIGASTPCMSNNTDAIETIEKEEIFAFPNPSENGIFQLSAPISCELIDAQGRKILSLNNTSKIDLSSFAKGLYILRSSKTIIKLVVQ